MAYNNNNNRNWNNNGGSNGNWNNNRNNNGGNWNNNNRQSQPAKKRSGAKRYKWTPTEGPNKGRSMMGVLGWRVSKRFGMLKYKANMTQKSVVNEQTGWAGSVLIEIINEAGQKAIYWGMMRISDGFVTIPDLNQCMSPNGGKGGYTGTLSKR